jgi:hypothetical protein
MRSVKGSVEGGGGAILEGETGKGCDSLNKSF